VGSSRERDESIDRLLRQSLKGPQQAIVTAVCLDAEVVAAMMDGGLSGPALAAAQSHLADCARCQNLLGALAGIDSSAPVVTPQRAHGWLTWAVPLAAVAAGVAIWVAVPHRNAVPVQEAIEVRHAGTEQGGPQVAPAPPAASAERYESSSREISADAKAKKTDDLAKQSADAALPAPAESGPAARSADAMSAARLNASLAETVAIDILSPDPMIRWRLAGSTVQRSTDGGVQWESQRTGTAAALTAGSAPSVSAIWVVGRGGVVLVSTDGGTWRRVPFPEMTDLSAVRARDAQSVSVTTADGRTFSTADAGATWVPRPLQDF
jgi:Photosynthesis system II assembly factor YCF48